MLISDWSSDVCSSDLRHEDRFPESQQARDEMERLKEEQQKEKDDDIELLADDVQGTVSTRETGSSQEDIDGVDDIDRDRKSDVQGKSVSVRGDLGGSRIIKR